jgi:hypothetical protein
MSTLEKRHSSANSSNGGGFQPFLCRTPHQVAICAFQFPCPAARRNAMPAATATAAARLRHIDRRCKQV